MIDVRRAGLTWPEMLVVCLVISVAGMIVTSAAIRSVQMQEPEEYSPTPPVPVVSPTVHAPAAQVPVVQVPPPDTGRKPPVTDAVSPPPPPKVEPEAKKPEKKGDPGLEAAIRTDLPQMLRMLIRGGADVNKANEEGLTPLGLAARLGKLQCAKILIAVGADVSGGTESGHAPIIEAAVNRHVYVATMLLDFGADKRVRNKDGLSLLHIAAEKGSEPLVKLFLGRGLDINDAVPAEYKLYKHRTPLDFALGSGNLDVISVLMNAGAKRGGNPG